MRGGEFLRGLMLIINYILIVFDNFLLVKLFFLEWYDEYVLCIEFIYNFIFLLVIIGDWDDRWGFKCFWRLVIFEYEYKFFGYYYIVLKIWIKIICWICNIYMLIFVLLL